MFGKRSVVLADDDHVGEFGAERCLQLVAQGAYAVGSLGQFGGGKLQRFVKADG